MNVRTRATVTLIMLATSIFPASADEILAPGPMLDKRKQIVTYLDKARKAGIGVKPYADALETIETGIKAGQSEDDVRKQVLSLCSALAQQVNNLKVLKVTHPAYRAINGTSGSSGSAGASKGAKAQVSEGEMEALLLTLVNKHRAEAGLGAVGPNSTLASIAKAHAADMAKRNFFDHINPDGRDPQSRARNGGWTGGVMENIAFTSNRGDGLTTTEVADVTLMNSPPHRSTILNTGVSQVGIGIVYDGAGGIRVCQLFAP